MLKLAKGDIKKMLDFLSTAAELRLKEDKTLYQTAKDGRAKEYLDLRSLDAQEVVCTVVMLGRLNT